MCGNNINNKCRCNRASISLSCNTNNTQIKKLINIHRCRGEDTSEVVVCSPSFVEAKLIEMIKCICRCAGEESAPPAPESCSPNLEYTTYVYPNSGDYIPVITVKRNGGEPERFVVDNEYSGVNNVTGLYTAILRGPSPNSVAFFHYPDMVADRILGSSEPKYVSGLDTAGVIATADSFVGENIYVNGSKYPVNSLNVVKTTIEIVPSVLDDGMYDMLYMFEDAATANIILTSCAEMILGNEIMET